MIYLGIGSNLGDKERNINKAIELIGKRVGTVVACSSFYYSAPQGFQSPNDFVNVVVGCQTSLSPEELLLATQQIENDLGRKTKSHDGHYHDRIIDIDILLYDDITVDTPELKIPHPLMQTRAFVMIPLKEITS